MKGYVMKKIYWTFVSVVGIFVFTSCAHAFEVTKTGSIQGNFQATMSDASPVADDTSFATTNQLWADQHKLEQGQVRIERDQRTTSKKVGVLEKKVDKLEWGAVDQDKAIKQNAADNAVNTAAISSQGQEIETLKNRMAGVEDGQKNLDAKVNSLWGWTMKYFDSQTDSLRGQVAGLDSNLSVTRYVQYAMFIVLVLLAIWIFRRMQTTPIEAVKMEACEWCNQEFPSGSEFMTHRTNCPARPRS